MATTYKTVSIRVTKREARLIELGGEALGISRSTLIQTASRIAAHRLGFFEDGKLVKADPDGWKDSPVRQKGELEEQLMLSLNPLELKLIRQASQWYGVSAPVFMVGSTLRFLANCKYSEPNNKKLSALVLPFPFEGPKRSQREPLELQSGDARGVDM